MAYLYPDESYCTSEFGHLLFKSKTDWFLTAEVIDVITSKGLAGTTHTDYIIKLHCLPKNSLQLDQRNFIITSRFRDLNRIHTGLQKLHKQLYLPGSFPQFAPTKLIGATAPDVIQKRRRAIEILLNFVFDNEVLRKSRILHEFVEIAREEVEIGTIAGTELTIDMLTEDASINTGGDHLTPTNIDQTSNSGESSDFSFPVVSIEDLGGTTQSSNKTNMSRLFPKLKENSNESRSNSQEDYIVIAGKLVSTAQRAEAEQEYELAFHCYKNAASSLIQGVQYENDVKLRNAVRKKTAKYLIKAEKLFRTYLAYDSSAFDVDAVLPTLKNRDADLMAFKNSNQNLQNYSIVGILPSLTASKQVLLVQEKKTGRLFVMKLLEKGSNEFGAVVLPSSVPHMVHLFHFFETEVLIILLLEYVSTGMLWNFLSPYFAKCDLEYQVNLYKDEPNDSSCPWFGPDSSELGAMYKGRRLVFSVDVDIQRVAELRDISSNADPSATEVFCTMGEDCMNSEPTISGDFFVTSDSNYTMVEEECPAQVNFSAQKKSSATNPASKSSLASSLADIRQMISSRSCSFASSLPESLVIHWVAQLISWFYIMHNEHEIVIGDFHPRNILLTQDGNISITYYGEWKSNGLKEFTEGYSAPECSTVFWQSSSLCDVWTIGSILFELLNGRSLETATPHGVIGLCELPNKDDVSLVAKNLLSKILVPVDIRLTLEDVRSHPLFASIDWNLYDNPRATIATSPQSSKTNEE